jgi:hypothetical protein
VARALAHYQENLAASHTRFPELNLDYAAALLLPRPVARALV